MRQLLVATHNQGKVKEFAQMLSRSGMTWLNLDDVGVTMDVEETGTTFRENAVLKAEAYAKETGLWTLAEDSGLAVKALNGEPGVYTARYGGPDLTHEERYLYLLKNMEGVTDRTAVFHCVIVLANPQGEIVAESEGQCLGEITLEPIGDGGFGYDPVFFVPEQGKTMAQLGEIKHQISHRSRALKQLQPQLRAILQ